MPEEISCRVISTARTKEIAEEEEIEEAAVQEKRFGLTY